MNKSLCLITALGLFGLGCAEDAPTGGDGGYVDFATAPALDLAQPRSDLTQTDGSLEADLAELPDSAAADLAGEADLALESDLAGDSDLAMGGGDLAAGGGDLAMGGGDLAMGGGDLAMGGGDLANPRDFAAPRDLATARDSATPGDLTTPRDLAAAGDLAGGCAPGSTRSCYSGPANSAGVGACKAGVQSCIGGSFGPCVGEVLPAPESCNGVDDDCNRAVDEGLPSITCGLGACLRIAASCVNGRPATCVPNPPAMVETCGDALDNNCNGLIDEGCGCVYVAPSGNDANPGTAMRPKRSIRAAIAAAGSNGLPKIVCVASGPMCPSTADYSESITMRDGVSVYGGYQASGNTWPRNGACVTRILDQDQNGVLFDATIVAPTVLAGFTINGAPTPTNAAITVAGSTGAVIDSNTINGGGQTTSYGINVTDGGGFKSTPLISRNGISGGTGTLLAIGVRSVNAAPTIRGSCDAVDGSGRCTSGACSGGSRYLRGRATGSTGVSTFGVRLEASPGAVVDQSSICAAGGTAEVAAVRIVGDAARVVLRANNMNASGLVQSAAAVWADACKGASPWIVDNFRLVGNSGLQGGRADGVRAVGDCHIRVDSNLMIIGGVESANNDANGVLCARDPMSGLASRCTVLNNTEIRGSGGGFPPVATGVRCEDGACARIEKNGRITGMGGLRAYGIRLGKTGPYINSNYIEAGCGSMDAAGILAEDAFPRVENNQITGKVCQNPNGAPSVAVRVLIGSGANEVDLHSNNLLAAGAGPCTGAALAFDVLPGGAPPAGPRGIVRNNILASGACMTRYGLWEQNQGADPRLVQNNDLWNQGGGAAALYRNENNTNLTVLGPVNALLDITAAGNLSADPGFVNVNHLPANSPCTNAGIATGAPAFDFEGQARPNQNLFDVGMDEYRP